MVKGPLQCSLNALLYWASSTCLLYWASSTCPHRCQVRPCSSTKSKMDKGNCLGPTQGVTCVDTTPNLMESTNEKDHYLGKVREHVSGDDQLREITFVQPTQPTSAHPWFSVRPPSIYCLPTQYKKTAARTTRKKVSF
jgi:hypothetical protein